MASKRNSARKDIVKTGSILALLLLTLAARAKWGIAPSFQYDLATIEAYARRIRDLQPKYKPQVEFVTKQEADRLWTEQYAENDQPERLVELHLFYRALDLVERDVDLAAASLEFRKSRVVGYYDSDSGEMVVILPDSSSPLGYLPLSQKLTYAHEYAHALQDQHFDLDALRERYDESGSFDQHLSLSALIEGDASFVAHDYLFELWSENPAAVEREWEEIENANIPEDEPLDLPAIFSAINDLKYTVGEEFVTELWIEHGWEGVNRAFSENPPQTSEQILHPERYFAGETALTVNPPDHSALVEQGWQLAYDDTVGEFYLREHLETRLNDPHSSRAAEGWGGDRLQIFTNATTEDIIWVWYQLWDSAAHADEFVEDYDRFLNRRYVNTSADGTCWQRDTTHCFARISETETRVSMAADKATALALLQLDG